MDYKQAYEVLKELKQEKERVKPIINEVIECLEELGLLLEPTIKKIFITKSVEYTTEKFNLLCHNGFSREEALQIIICESNQLKQSLKNIKRK